MTKCIICKNEITDKHFSPFCSQRCKNIDLNRWFTGAYVIPERQSEKKVHSDKETTGQEFEISLYDVEKAPR